MSKISRINVDGVIYKVIAAMPTEGVAHQCGEAWQRQTGGIAHIVRYGGKWIVASVDDDQTVLIKCKACKHKFNLPAKVANRLTWKNEGYIPCENCSSHATTWNKQLVKGK